MAWIKTRSGLSSAVAQGLIFAIFCFIFSTLALGQKRIAPPSKSILKKAPVSTPQTETSGCSSATFQTNGNSASDGTDGNIRTFAAGGISVKASAWSQRQSDGLWQTGFLGAFGPGLGVTDRGETGNDGTHRVDNEGGYWDYVLFEFDQNVVVDKVSLASVVNDSDASVWIGTVADPYNNHVSVDSAFLSNLTLTEDNTTASTSDRWADINASGVSGNILVVAAWVNDDTPEDQFKVGGFTVTCPTAPPPAKVTIIKEILGIGGVTADPTSFGFTATNLGTPSFQLVDQDVTGPDRFVNNNITAFGAGNPITVTEDLTQGWTLNDLYCTETGTQNSTVDFANRKVTLIPEAGESITCTFQNVQLRASAAKTTISGRALTATSRGVSGAVLTLLDPQTGQTKAVRTNTFGYYTIKDVEVGKFYLLSISHRRYSFAQSTRAINLTDQLANMNFVQTF